MDNQVEVKEKKKGNVFLKILLLIIILGIGIGIGYFAPKMDFFKKANKEAKETKDTEELKKEDNSSYTKPQAKEGYKLLKEDSKEFDLNNKKVHYVAYYYQSKKHDKGLLKEVYFEGKEALKLYDLVIDLEGSVEDYIDKDIKNSQSLVKYLKDAKSNDKYLLYYYHSEFEWGPEEDAWAEYSDCVAVINDKGEVLFDREYYNSTSVTYLIVDTKEEVLDRNSYIYEAEEDSDIQGTYAIYGGDGTEDGKFSSVEFKDDHFYGIEFDDDCNVYDYKYVIENGKFKKSLIKKYDASDRHIDGAGASC